jgi:hypothetical protein
MILIINLKRFVALVLGPHWGPAVATIRLGSEMHRQCQRDEVALWILCSFDETPWQRVINPWTAD